MARVLFLFILAVNFVGTAKATLIDRGPNLVYDDVLDITWVRDAALCATLNNCINRDDSLVTGGMTWADANEWVENLAYQGFSDWRLPYASIAAGAGPTGAVHSCTGSGGADEVACRDNEIGYMYYYNLGGSFGDNMTGDRTAVGGETLASIQFFHWSATEAFVPGLAWVLLFNHGDQGISGEDAPLAAWAVRQGDVFVAIPEPASGLLLGVGVLAVVWARRRR